MKYPILQGLRPDGMVYYDEFLGLTEAVLPPGEWKTAHAPAILEAGNGDLLCVWFAGTFEGSGDVSIVCARLPKGGTGWEAPVQVSNDPARSDQNPSLFAAPNGEIWVLYTSQLDRVEGKDNMQYTSVIRRQRSGDFGKTWSAADVLIEREGSFCRQPIQVLASGRWIFSNWLCSDCGDFLAGDPTVLNVSDDEGQTWKTVMMPESKGRVHANVIELEDGHLVAFMRSRAADFIYKSESKDNGDSWSVPKATVLPNNNSSISALKLTSGRIAIAYNPTQTVDPKADEVAWPGLRCPVAVALSEDGGETWPMIRHFERGEGFVGAENRTNNRQYEYPFLMQDADEKLHLVYAYRDRLSVKWILFEEKDVMGAKRETVGVYNPTSAQIGKK